LNRHVHLRRAAEDDIDGHFLFLAEESVAAALRFHDAARSALDRLGDMPEIGSPRPTSSSALAGLRMWPIPDFPNYLIFYFAIEHGIDVVRVLHASRDLGSILGDS
jgi:toxin ParE1/3/4